MATTWLDRLSTPTSNSRRASPASRKIAPTSARPSFDGRSTSLSVLTRANSSSSSLQGPLSTKTTTASGLKQELSRPPDVQDSLLVLERILGHSIARDDEGRGNHNLTPKPEELHEDIDFQDRSLAEFLSISEKAKAPVEVTVRSIQTVEEYERERNSFEDLHKTIAKCDDVLKSVESSLAGFQHDLGTVSAEIETLQDRSTALTTRLENRKVVEKTLGPATEEVSISPSVIRTISEGQINDDWVKALAEFEKRSRVIEAKMKDGSTVKAVQDAKPILENLRHKANERIRDHVIAQIKAMRSPNINAQIIQQNNLFKFRDLFTFLSRHQRKLSEEIAQAYTNTMRWYYSDHFARYRQALEKLKVVPIGKEDTIGVDPSISRGSRAGASSALFDLGRRGEILSQSINTALSSYLASEDKSTHHLEVPYHNFLLALVDNVSVEYQFLTTFFSSLPYSYNGRRCGETFAPTLVLSREMAQTLLDTSTLDCLGILLCIRVTQKLAFELQRRRIPALDDHVNGLLILLWPAFQKAMDTHTESIKTLSSSIYARNAASKLTFNMTGSSNSADSLTKASMAPHFLTQRFGQFLYGILAISKESGDDEPVASSLARMRNEYENFVIKAAKSVGGADRSRRERFIENQLVLVETIISDTGGKLATEAKTWLANVRNRGAATS